MALTTTFSISPLLFRTLPTTSVAFQSDTVGFTDGGWATVAAADDGHAEATIYDAAGNVTGSISESWTDPKIAYATDGQLYLVLLGRDAAGETVVRTSNGLFKAVTTNTAESNADIAGLGGGAFIVVDQQPFSGSDHDIQVHIRDANGNPATFTDRSDFTIDSSIDDDENPSVAKLADGGFVVAWERIDSSGHSAVWYAVYNDDATTRQAATKFDDTGTINHLTSVTGLQAGGFAISYEDNERDGTQTDIKVAVFKSNGIASGMADFLPTNDTEAALTMLSNGYVLTTFTNELNGDRPDSDIRATLIEDTTGNTLTSSSDPLTIDGSADINSESSVSAIGLARFVVSYSSSFSGDITQKTFQLVRTVIGDAGDNSFTGDDAVDIVIGLGGNDDFSGGANNDTLSGGDGNDQLNGGNGNDKLNGGANNDFLIGGAGNDRLQGGTGADAMLGGLGNDVFYVDNVNDEVTEAAGGGSDRVFSSVSYSLQPGQEIEALSTTNSAGTGAIDFTGNQFGQQLVGNAGNNLLRGNGGNDTLIGGAGVDKLIGGGGLDQLNGGVGNDSFIYTALGDSGTTPATRDQITGFASGDKIDVHPIDAIAGGADNDFVLDTDGSFSAGEIRQTVTASGHLLLEFNADADAAADMSILLRDHTTFLTNGDFVL